MGFAFEILATLAAVPALAFACAYFAIYKSLPEYVRFKSARERDLPFQVMDRVHELEELGFERFGTPVYVDLFVSVILVPLYHRETATFATSFYLETRKTRGIELITMLEPNGALTSGVVPGLGTLPPWRGWFQQILPRASADELLAMHLDALEFLAQRGVPQRHAPFTIEDIVQESLRAKRLAFLAAGFKHTLVATWRSLIGKNPYQVPLDAQRDIRDQLTMAPRPRAYGLRPMA